VFDKGMIIMEDALKLNPQSFQKIKDHEIEIMEKTFPISSELQKSIGNACSSYYNSVALTAMCNRMERYAIDKLPHPYAHRVFKQVEILRNAIARIEKLE
jgi:hypothetical protein